MKNIQNIEDVIRSLFEFGMLLKHYKIGNSSDSISILDLELLSISGHEHIVFKYKDKIVKIHRKHFVYINNLDEQNILSLIGIPTKRILMPTDPLYNIKGNIEGYVMNEVTKKESISNESMDHFIDEARIIQSDKDLLSLKTILLDDFHVNNAIYNGKINIVDSGRYVNLTHVLPYWVLPQQYQNIEAAFINKDVDKLRAFAYDFNNEKFNKFIYSYIMDTVLDCKDTYSRLMYLSKIRQYFINMADEIGTSSYVDVIETISNKNMTVEEFAKTLKKNADINLFRTNK